MKKEKLVLDTNWGGTCFKREKERENYVKSPVSEGGKWSRTHKDFCARCKQPIEWDDDAYEWGHIDTNQNRICNKEIIPEEKVSQTDEQIFEELAELEHLQWIKWSKSLMSQFLDFNTDNEVFSQEAVTKRVQKKHLSWLKLWKPYSELTEEQKEQDRVWARASLEIMQKARQSERKKFEKELEEARECFKFKYLPLCRINKLNKGTCKNTICPLNEKE